MSGEARDHTSELSATDSANTTQSRVAQQDRPGINKIRTCATAHELPWCTTGWEHTHRAHEGAGGGENPVGAGDELALRHHRVRKQRAQRDHPEQRCAAWPSVDPVSVGHDLRSGFGVQALVLVDSQTSGSSVADRPEAQLSGCCRLGKSANAAGGRLTLETRAQAHQVQQARQSNHEVEGYDKRVVPCAAPRHAPLAAQRVRSAYNSRFACQHTHRWQSW